MKAPFPVVEVVWEDAASDAQGWEVEVEVKIDIVMTIGFLIAESPAGLVIASTACDERSHNSRMTIPRTMVKSIKYLRGKPKAVVPDASA
jgi:hypothetical protein